MKIKQADYVTLQGYVSEFLTNHCLSAQVTISELVSHYKGRGLTFTRFVWDVYHASVKDKVRTDRADATFNGSFQSYLYDYLNDSHIETAMKSILAAHQYTLDGESMQYTPDRLQRIGLEMTQRLTLGVVKVETFAGVVGGCAIWISEPTTYDGKAGRYNLTIAMSGGLPTIGRLQFNPELPSGEFTLIDTTRKSFTLNCEMDIADFIVGSARYIVRVGTL